MTCGKNMGCVLCDAPRMALDSQGVTVFPPPEEPPAYEGEGNLTYELRTKRHSRKPHIRLCTGCLQRVLGVQA